MANGAESEPASRKDEVLLRLAPNLVLDGLQLAAEAVGATEAHLYLHYAPGPEIVRALAERSARGLDRLGVTITAGAAAVPGRPGDRAGEPARRRPRAAHVPAAAGERARPGRRADPGAERGDAGPPGADRAVRPALVPRRRHQRPSRAACSPRCTAPTPGPTSARRPSARRCAPCSATAPRRRPGWSAATTAPGCRCRTRPSSRWTTPRCAGSAPPPARACWWRCRPTGAA